MGAADGKIVYEAQGRRDPFVPLVSLASRDSSGFLGLDSIEEVKVEGVLYDPKQGSVVIVNGAILKEGEESGAMKVIKIRPDGAVFLINGVETFKPLYQDESTQKGQPS